MKMKLHLDNACGPRGADMGRPNRLPADVNEAVTLRMEALRMVDGCYDTGGAYWGCGSGTRIYCAHGDAADVAVLVFVRASSRDEAKAKVRESLPNASFLR